MLNNLPPRPRWNHQCVKEATALEFVDSIRDWAESMGVVDEGVDDKEFLAVLTLALVESPDAYQAGRYLEDFIEWPVTGELFKILEQAFHRMKFVTRDFVHAWVMENNIRITAKRGDLIRCKVGDLEITGRLQEVIKREAKGYFIPNGRDQHMPVYAEEILQVLPERKKKPDAPKSA